MSGPRLFSTTCAICGTADNADELHAANFKTEAFNPEIFSARRLPDRIHYRMVSCRTCGLVRSDPVADSETLGRFYRQSSFDYSSEVAPLMATYGRCLDRLLSLGGGRDSLLEIGCGNGFFLEEAMRRGFHDARGVEPSVAAVQQARPGIRDKIVNDIMRPGLFPENSFDVVCLFQVLDHFPDPVGVLSDLCVRCTAINAPHFLINGDPSRVRSTRIVTFAGCVKPGCGVKPDPAAGQPVSGRKKDRSNP